MIAVAMRLITLPNPYDVKKKWNYKMQSLVTDNGILTAQVNGEGNLLVELTRFGDVVQSLELDLSNVGGMIAGGDAVLSPYNTSAAVELVADGQGGHWVVVQRMYFPAGSDYYSADSLFVEYLTVPIDEDLSLRTDIGQIVAEGPLFAISNYANADRGLYPPLTVADVSPSGDLVFAFGASPDDVSDPDALPLHLSRIDFVTGAVLYTHDTGLRGEPTSASLVLEGGSTLRVESFFNYASRFDDLFTTNLEVYDVPYDSSARLVTVHDLETGHVLEPLQVTSTQFEPKLYYIYDDTILGTAGDDNIHDLGGHNFIDVGAGNDTVFSAGDYNEVKLGPGDDYSTASGHIAASAGDDTVFGGSGRDLIGGGPGNDSIMVGRGDTVRGGQGDDFITGKTAGVHHASDGAELSGGWGIDTIIGTHRDDVLAGGPDADNLQGWGGDDLIGGGTGNDTIKGLDHNDTVYAGQGDDSIEGNDGDDYLKGGFGDDTIKGGSGNDRIEGTIGNDLLIGDDPDGDTGYDIFVFTRFTDGETDTITDFEKFEDRIEISGLQAGTDAERLALLEISEYSDASGTTGTLIEAEGHSIILLGYDHNSVSIDDFIFV